MKKEDKIMKKQNEVELFSCYLRCVMRSMHANGRKILLKQNLTFPQYYTLFLLSKENNCCMDFLKNDLKTSGAVATKVVDHLIEKKLVDRGRWSEDKRKVNVSAPSAAWRFLWGESPDGVKLNQQPVPSVAIVRKE